MPSSDESVQCGKKVLVLRETALLFLDFCHQLSKIAVIPSDRRHVLSNLLLGAKIWICFRLRFKISDTDILAAILLQDTGLGPLCETPQLQPSLEETFDIIDRRGLFD